MDDLGTLCLMGVIALVAMVLLPRLMSAMSPRRYETQGDEYSRYDDETIRSQGGFGRPASESPEYDDPDIRSRGSFGGGSTNRSSGGGFFSRRGSSGGSRTNSPNIRSRGGFGGGRKN
jgi:hypothetical protein